MIRLLPNVKVRAVNPQKTTVILTEDAGPVGWLPEHVEHLLVSRGKAEYVRDAQTPPIDDVPADITQETPPPAEAEEGAGAGTLSLDDLGKQDLIRIAGGLGLRTASKAAADLRAKIREEHERLLARAEELGLDVEEIKADPLMLKSSIDAEAESA